MDTRTTSSGHQTKVTYNFDWESMFYSNIVPNFCEKFSIGIGLLTFCSTALVKIFNKKILILISVCSIKKSLNALNSWLLVFGFYKEDYLHIFKCVSF